MKKYIILLISAALTLCACTKEKTDIPARTGYFIYDDVKYEISSLVCQTNNAGYTDMDFFGGNLKIDINRKESGSGPLLFMSMFHFENGEYDSVQQAYIGLDHKAYQYDTKRVDFSDVSIKIDLDDKTKKFTMDMTAKYESADGTIKDFTLHSTGIKQEKIIN